MEIKISPVKSIAVVYPRNYLQAPCLPIPEWIKYSQYKISYLQRCRGVSFDIHQRIGLADKQ
jgi:hypothetical protein